MGRRLAVAAAVSFVFVTVLSTGTIAGPAATSPQAGGSSALPDPVLSVETAGGTSLVRVEAATPSGTTVSHLLRATAARVVPGATGRDAEGRAAFVRWTEGDETWFSYSRNGGASWTDARVLQTDLRLRAEATAPSAPAPEPPAGLTLDVAGRLFLVQFRTISLPEWRTALEDVGAEILRFFPHNGHIVRMDPGLVDAASSLSFVERIEPYQPAWRLEPALADWVASGTDPGVDVVGGRVRVWVVGFEWGEAGKQALLNDAKALGSTTADYWPSGHELELWVTRDQLRLLAAHDDVFWVDRWSAPENDMDKVRQDSGADSIESSFSYCGTGVRGEVMDDGVEDTHQDFDGIMSHGPHTVNSHGTNSYGVVFGNGNRDGDGQASATGHLPCGQGIFADYGSYGGDRFAHTQELKNAPYFASFQTNSWGSSRTISYTSQSHLMDDIIWRLDIAITQSQSNAGNRQSRPQAWAKNIISVGGIYHENTLGIGDDAWNHGASIGPAEDQRMKPDIAYWYDDVHTTTTGNGYRCCFGGTSAATPESAGVLGLMAEMWADNVWNTNPQGATVFDRLPHFSTLKALLINSATQYPFTGRQHDLTRTHQGWGRPNAQNAMDRAGVSFIVDADEPLLLNQSVVYTLEVPAGQPDLKVTMVYPDPPGTISSTLHRINDLNVRVTSPSLDVYHGNIGLDAGVWSTTGGVENGLDTVENVFIQNPTPGLWSIRVEAVEMNQDAHLDTPATDAVFSLVVTGAELPSGGLGTPGEASEPGGDDIFVIGWNPTTEEMTLSYVPACGSTGHVIEYGDLNALDVATYNWAGQTCGIGTNGLYFWDVTGLPDSLFFVIVGRDANAEGSYGKDHLGAERPEDTTSAACPLAQDLSQACTTP